MLAKGPPWIGVLYERRHTRLISDYGGLWKQLPLFSSIFLVAMLSSIGLPGLNGFVGEFLILLGTFKANTVAAVVAVSGVILGAVYMLRMYQRVIFGPLTNPENAKMTDLSRREIAIFVPLIALMLFMGLYPQPFLSRMEKSVEATLARIHKTHEEAPQTHAALPDEDVLNVTFAAASPASVHEQSALHE